MTKNKNLIREKNLTLLKQYLFEHGQGLKSELAEQTGISVVTINSLVKQLVEEQVLIEGSSVKPTLGRPATAYHFNYDLDHFLLLSIQEKLIGEERKLILVGKIVNLAGEVKIAETFGYTEVTIEFLLEKIEYFLNSSIPFSKIGLSIPGKTYQGVVLSSWEGLFDQWKIEQAIAELTPIPVHIENDAHLLTIGATISEKLSRNTTIVGIFYPENSMPGVTIYTNGLLLGGKHNLAGEAKYLPHLIDSDHTLSKEELVHNLIEILAIYNVVIAPDIFVISADSANTKTISQAFHASPVISKQVSQPDLFFVENFQEALETGLLWLVTKNSDLYL